MLTPVNEMRRDLVLDVDSGVLGIRGALGFFTSIPESTSKNESLHNDS